MDTFDRSMVVFLFLVSLAITALLGVAASHDIAELKKQIENNSTHEITIHVR